MNLGLWGAISPKTILGAIKRSSVPADTTAPTVTITANASTITAAPFTATFTFSEDVTGFAVGDITVGNGSAGTFNTVSASVYTAVITPTATGTVTVDVGAGVCTDASGNNNTAATQFSILYIGATTWYDFSDITTLFQDAARSTPVAANSDPIGGDADKSGNANHLSNAEGTVRPLYKTNIQNSKSAGLWDGNNDTLRNTSLSATLSTSTIFVVAKWVSLTGDLQLFDGLTGHRHAAWFTGGNKIQMVQGGSVLSSGIITISNMAIYTFVFTGSTTSCAYQNGTKVINDGNAGNHTLTGLNLGTFFNGANNVLSGYIAEFIVIPSVLADIPRIAIQNYLNTKWACF